MSILVRNAGGHYKLVPPHDLSRWLAKGYVVHVSHHPQRHGGLHG